MNTADHKIELLEKAWVLNPDNLEEPYFHDTDIAYYGTKGQAKKLAEVDNAMGKTLDGKDVSFLNIKVIRRKSLDKIMYDDLKIRRWEIKRIVRRQKIIDLPKDKTYYVQDRRSYVGNAVLWWAIDGKGYLTDLAKAHKYTYDEIIKFDPRATDIIWESEHAESAIRQYVDMQGLNSEFSI